MDHISKAEEEAKKATGSSIEEGVDDLHRWNDRTALIESIKLKLRTDWRKDSKILNQFFQSCYLNWKVYTGEKTPHQSLTLHALHRQATKGDANLEGPSDLSTMEGQRWLYHSKFRGMEEEMAKKRYITFLAQIHPSLIDVMPSEKPPPGFSKTKEGEPICAKCNTLVGCIRPILDQNKGNLHQQLFEAEELSDPETLKLWIRNALANQRCIWGLHRPISKQDAQIFSDWFDLDENRGFIPYSSISILSMVRSFVHFHYEKAYTMINKRKQQDENRAKETNEKENSSSEMRDDETITFTSNNHDSDYVDAESYNNQAIRCMNLKEIYEQFSGEEFIFELPCERITEECNKRRLLNNGKNHNHEVDIDPPIHFNRDTFEESIFLRRECQRMGINPSTGIVKDIGQRCEIYREKIRFHLQKIKQAEEAKIKNEKRAIIHAQEKAKVKDFSTLMMKKQCNEACNLGFTDHILALLKRGCNPDEESTKGITPLLAMVLNQENVEKVEYVLKKNANVNYVNKYGMSALMYSCRLKDLKMVHLLLKYNAKIMLKGVNGLTALHICIQNNCEEIIRVMIEYVKDQPGDLLRVNRFLDYQDDDGNTALILSAKSRNSFLSYLLSSLGASQTLRNKESKTAASVARTLNHIHLADWFEKKINGGISKVVTYSDIQFDSKVKYATSRLVEVIQKFGSLFLNLVHKKVSLHPLGTPFIAYSQVEDKKEVALEQQQRFVDNSFKYFLHLFPELFGRSPVHHTSMVLAYDGNNIIEDGIEDMIKSIKDTMYEIVTLVEEGYVYPSLETLSQPLPWTPLMCAVAIHDIDSIRRILNQGTDIEYQNRDGITVLMLASQLNYTYIMTELILSGADYERVDNKGYNSLSYATSLPKPSIMCSNLVDVILREEVQGPRLLTGEEVILHAMKIKKEFLLSADLGQDLKSINPKYLYAGLDELVKLNMIEAAPDRAIRHRKYINLLQRYGLTSITNDVNLLYQLKSASWRFGSEDEELEPEGDKSEHGKNSYEWESSNFDFDETDIEGIEGELSLLMSNGKFRCPICTLLIPCPHFFRLNSLKLYLKNHKCVKDKYGTLKIQTNKSKKKDNEIPNYEKILKEAGLDDRKTNRLETFIDPYFKRAMQVEREKRLSDQQQSSTNTNPEELFDEPILYDHYTTNHDKSSKDDEYVLSDNLENLVQESNHDQQIEQVQESHSSNTNEYIEYNVDNVIKDNFNQANNNNNNNSNPIMEITDEFKSGIKENINFSEEIIDNNIYDPYQQPISSILKKGTTKKSNKSVKFQLPFEEKNSLDNFNITLEITETKHEKQDIDIPNRFEVNIKSYQNIANESNSIETFESKEILSTNFLDEDDFQLQEKEDSIVKNQKNETYPNSFISEDSISIIKNQNTNPDLKKYKIIPLKTTKITTYPINQEIEYNAIDKISISGWIFVHFTTTNSGVYPLESLSLSSSSFSIVLSHLNKKIFFDWPDENEYFSIVNPHTWDCRSPKCILCKIGYVRSKKSISKYLLDKQKFLELGKEAYKLYLDSYQKETLPESDILDLYLCLQCLYRKELYQKVYRSIPRHLRRAFDKPWPLIEPTLIEDHTELLEPLIPNNNRNKESINELEKSEHLSLGKLTSLINEAKELRPSKEKELYQKGGIQSLKNKNKPEVIASVKTNKKIQEYEEDIRSEVTMSDFDNISLATTLTISDNVFHESSDFTFACYLASKDNFEEAERTIRNILSKPNINDNEGLINFEHILLLYSDLYFSMGFSYLAFLILLDFADHCANLLGPGDTITCKARARVVNCLLKLQKVDIADKYQSSCLIDIEEKIKSTSKLTIKGLQDRFFREEKQIFLTNNTFWLSIIKPIESEIGSKNKILKNHLSYRKLVIFQTYEIGGLYSFLTSQIPFHIVNREIFFNFCTQGGIFIFQNNNLEIINLKDDIKTLTMLIKFVKLYLRIQNSEDKNFKNLIFNELCTKYLSQILIPTSFLSRIFFYHATEEDLEIHSKVVNMESSEQANIKIFNNFFKIIIKILLPHYRYFFLFSNFGSNLRNVDSNYNIILSTSVTIIQNLVRKFLYKMKIRKLLLLKIEIDGDDEMDINSESDSDYEEEVTKYEENQ